MSLQWKMQTNFPFSRVFVLGVILFFLGLASMIIAIIAFVTQSWGNYVGTGMWGGATVLASGITAVFVSRHRSLASVKTFCICSVIAMFTSLTMLILSAGGLTLNSGFYSRIDLVDYNKRTSNLIHASLLVISVFCLSGSVLAVIVCCKYIFFENYNKPKRRRHHRNVPDSTIRVSSTLRGGAPNNSSQRTSNSRTPLHTSEQISRRHSDIFDGNRVQIEYRRSHKRSASDQPQANSHPRRPKHGPPSIKHGPSSSNTNLLLPSSVRYYPDRRSGSNRNSIQGIEVRGSIRETDRPNLAPPRQAPSRPVSQIHVQSRSPASASPKVRLPTDFNEEELPPYEAVESAANAMNSSHSDSGDESDTENSSSTDAHSYIAADEDGIEAVPMVEMLSQENQLMENTRQHITTQFTSSHDNTRRHSGDHTRERHSCAVLSSSDHREIVMNEVFCNEDGAAVTMRKVQNRTSRPVLSYINSQPSHQGDCEHLLSVSPEVCAITGESPEPSQTLEGHKHHIVQENFYENGPCYENIRCGGRNVEGNTMNHLSKTSSVIMTEMTKARTSTREKGAKKVPVQVITHTSPVSNASPQSPQNSFGSTLSAFRPVGTASSALSPHRCCPSLVHSPPLLHSNKDNHSPQNEAADALCGAQNLPFHKCINAHTAKRYHDSSGPACMYIEQGAIPKAGKHREEASDGNKHTSMSWKNIPLPLSYNHSESASNESEKKLPSKTIPFADSNPDISRPLLKKEEPAQTSPSRRLSPSVCPSNNLTISSTAPLSSTSVSAPNSSLLRASPFGAASEALLAVSSKCNSKIVSEVDDTQSQAVQAPSMTVMSNTSVSSVREASTQVNNGSTSRWHSHRMGGNQSLLQSRREELHKCQLSNRTVDASSRAARPTSMPSSGGLGFLNQGISGLAADRQSRIRSNEAPSHSANHPGQSQQQQSLALRQNHLLQHYPLQPQQPRLGVQLHQRRQQQHQLQQNIESQQQHQQMQQQQQLLQQPQQGNQQNLQDKSDGVIIPHH